MPPKSDPEASVEEPLLLAEADEVDFGDIAKEFSLMGWIGFGGPAAHIGLFQRVRCCMMAH